jgi:hypothetical protein
MRHHGVVATTCIHGFAPETCLICQTLGSTATKTKEPKLSRREARQADRAAANPVPAVRAPAPVARQQAPPTGSLGLRALGILFLIVVAFFAFWWVLHFVLGILHVLEIFAAAVVAGYLGYVIGVYRGRRSGTRR